MYKVRDVHPDTKPTDTALPENIKLYNLGSLLQGRYNPTSDFGEGPLRNSYKPKREVQNAIDNGCH